MKRRTLWSLAAPLGVIACLVPCVARADAAADAKDLFSRGRDMRTAGDCASAVTLFRKAYDLYPTGLGSLRNLAECEEQLGHFASSRRAWLDLGRALVTEDARDAHKYEGWKQDAQQAAARLAPRLASVTIDLRTVGPDGAAADPKGVDVTLDGEAIAPAIVGTALERDPGHHVVRAAGAVVKTPQESAVDLAPGDAKHVALRVVVTGTSADAAAGAPPAATGPSPTFDATSDADRGRATRRTLGWVSVGVGAASLIGAGISLAVRQSAIGDLNGECHAGLTDCPASARDTASRGQTASVLFDVLSVIGVVGVGGGLALVLTSQPQAQQAGFVFTPTPRGASATWRF
jgi:hypothetical protein